MPMAAPTSTEIALDNVAFERRQQDGKWGTQRHGMPVWLTVLQEEVGEAAAEILRLRTEQDGDERHGILCDLAGEVTQIAAVAVAWLEHLHEAIAARDGLPGEVAE